MMLTLRCYNLVFVCLLAHAVALQWPLVEQNAQETLPNLELSLVPPLHPWPQVAAELGNLEDRRESMENTNMDKLQRELNKAIINGRHRIGDAIGEMMHLFDDPKLVKVIFLERRPVKPTAILRQIPQDVLASSELSVKVDVLPATAPDPLLRADIDDIEFQRTDAEKRMFESASSNLDALLSFVLNELEVQVNEQVSSIVGAAPSKKTLSATAFMEEGTNQLPVQSNIRVIPTDEKYPTIVSMVQAMETRRDIVESLERRRILENELNLLMECNVAMEKGLKAVISRLLAQHNNLVRSSQNIATA